MPLSVKDVLEQFGDNVVSNAQRELGATKTRNSYKAKWKNGKLQSYKVVKRKRKSDNTGALRESLSYKVLRKGDLFILEISALDYAIYVDQGRKPGKGIPVTILKRWIKSKPVRLQKDGGGFVKQTDKAINSLSFLINRKIKTFGIEPTNFMSNSVDKFQPKLAEELTPAYAAFIADKIRDKFN
tara:strand:+ start:297 stop:848 length:552 start_codon:yes stop_codon:yes gene_type:complete